MGDTRWQIWKAIDHLEAVERNCDYQKGITDQVIFILKLWANTWVPQKGDKKTIHEGGQDKDDWKQSFLNKRTLLHEVEECMVALYYLDRWRARVDARNMKRFVAVDVCGGKGIFSMFLRYMGALYWNENQHDGTDHHDYGNSSQRRPSLDHIILLEKASSTVINWDHLDAALPVNGNFASIDLVNVHVWESTNLHDYDLLVDRFHSTESSCYQLPLALTGIHLCKLLSPSMISLANLLGPEKCPYVCLAPCCMPREVVSKQLLDSKRCIPILRYEDETSRDDRLRILQQRKVSRKKSLGSCLVCQADDHWFKQCPLYLANNKDGVDTEEQRQDVVVACAPCWNCGQVGHFKMSCPNSGSCEPPVGQMIQVGAVLQSSYPLLAYCEILVPALEDRFVEIIEANLQNGTKHRVDNWNSRRKSLYIVTVS